MDMIRHYLLSGPLSQAFRGDFDAALLALRYDGALVGILLGVVYLLYGWRVFRILMTIHLAVVGFLAGVALGGVVFLAITTGLVLATAGAWLAWTRTRPTAAAVAGLYAAVLALGVLLAQRWFRGELGLAINIGLALAAGGGIGWLVHRSYRVAVIGMTSLHGAAGLVGGWATVLLLYPRSGWITQRILNAEPLLLPCAVLIVAALGFIYQWRFSGSSQAGSARSQSAATESRSAPRRRLAA